MYSQRAFVVTVGEQRNGEKGSQEYEAVDALAEVDLLAQSAGWVVVGHRHQSRVKPRARTLFGPGTLSEISAEAAAHGASTIVFDCDMSEQRVRNISKTIGSAFDIVDRTHLILEIFSQHANSREGQLQTSEALIRHRLASLSKLGKKQRNYRFRRGWISNRRAQLHSDLAKIEESLSKIRRARLQRRRKRQAAGLSTIVLIGYTNAGKSTLFNALTSANVSTSPRAFETVDPTTRIIRLPSRRRAILVDTVGLIRNTPTILLSGFSASLEEVRFASLILRVTDVSDANSKEHETHVDSVIHQLQVRSIPQLRVFNKIDLISPEVLEQLEIASSTSTAYVSGHLRKGLNDLLERIDFQLTRDPLKRLKIKLPYSEVKLAAEIGARARIFAAIYHDREAEYDLQVEESFAQRLGSFVIEKQR